MLKFKAKRAVHRLKSTLNRFFLYIFSHQNQPTHGQVPHHYRHLFNTNAFLQSVLCRSY